MSTALYVGTDVSQAVNRTRFVDAGGIEACRRFESANDLPGSKALATEAIQRADTIGAEEIRWALEATNLFWWHLATYLTTSPELVARGLKLYSFNPRVVAKFREAYPDLDKGDWVDAMVIADRLRFGRLPAECYLDERYQPLQRLTRYRKHLVDTIVREKQVALGYVWLKLSGYELEEEGLTNTFGATSQAILERYLTPDEIVAAPFEELVSLIAAESRGKADADGVARAVQQAARRSYRLPGSMVEPVNLVLSSSLTTIRTLTAQLKPLGRAIAAELEVAPRQTLNTIPGLGPVFTAGIVAEVGNIFRFADEEKVAKFAGLTWRRYQTGQFEGEDRPLTKTGNRYLRYYLVEGANSVRLHAEEFGSYYGIKYAEATRHKHKRGLVLTAQKLVRLVDSMLRSGQIHRSPGARKAP